MNGDLAARTGVATGISIAVHYSTARGILGRHIIRRWRKKRLLVVLCFPDARRYEWLYTWNRAQSVQLGLLILRRRFRGYTGSSSMFRFWEIYIMISRAPIIVVTATTGPIILATLFIFGVGSPPGVNVVGDVVGTDMSEVLGSALLSEKQISDPTRG